jgi:hypothetical protein
MVASHKPVSAQKTLAGWNVTRQQHGGGEAITPFL